MPRARLTKSVIDAIPTPASELVYWDETLPGFGVKVTPAGRKVFVVLYRTAGAGSRLRKYTDALDAWARHLSAIVYDSTR